MGVLGHLDANFYYGQVEALFRPEVRGKAFIVGGDQESRKGIVLTKSPRAKEMGIKTGSSVRDALRIYPNLIVLPANYPLYLYISHRMREIVLQYADAIKPFGSDEMWFSVHGNRTEAMETIEKIRQAIWKELCLTVSIGVANNLPYAKLGSDIAPNNSVFVAWDEDREKVIYPLPVSDLLYVGSATNAKFKRAGISTIGDLANTDPRRVCEILRCKTGRQLWVMANGQDKTPITKAESAEDVKSIGNSNTMPEDLTTDDDVRAAFYMLADSVAQRMRESGYEATTLEITLRDNDLYSISRRMKLQRPTNLAAELVPLAMTLFRKHYRWGKPIRSLGIRGADLVPEGSEYQLSLYEDEDQRKKLDEFERCMDRLRGRFGKNCVQRGVLMKKRLKSVNANNDIGDAPTFYTYH